MIKKLGVHNEDNDLELDDDICPGRSAYSNQYVEEGESCRAQRGHY